MKNKKKILPGKTSLSQEEKTILSEWILSEQGQQTIEADVANKWSSYDENQDQPFDSEKSYRQLEQQIDKQKRTIRIHKYLRYTLETAAAIFVVLAVSLFFRKEIYSGKIQPQYVEVYNPKGLRTKVVLPDSTCVVLNADSRISYVDQFSGRTRTVKLTGEAFFEVTKDSLRPFIVEAGSAKMTVLGTTFNVRAYPGDKRMETTLIEGSLKVDVGRKENMLEPGKQIVVDKISQKSTLQDVDTDKAIGWMEGKLYFQSMPFEEIAAILGRTFSVHITITKKDLQQKIFNGRFERGESLEQILRVMQTSVDFQSSYDKETNTMVIY